jgi:hypothetical protein
MRTRRTGREGIHTRVVQDKRPKAIEKFIKDEISLDTSISSEEFESMEDRKFSKVESEVTLRGLECAHVGMRYCCPQPCGHLVCPDCGLYWDEGAER